MQWDLHESDCSDPRDRIAAVYALASGPAWPLRQYDPSQWGEMYMAAASHYINTSAAGSYAILLHLYDFGPIKPGTCSEVPSWVPDWSARRQERLPDTAVTNMSNLSAEEYYRIHVDWAGKMQSEWRWLFETSSHSRMFQQRNREVYHLRVNGNPSLMTLTASGRRLRLDCHPLTLFDQCGTVRRVICPSTTSISWQADVWKTLPEDPTDLLREGPIDLMRELSEEGSLFMLLARILAEEDKAAHKPSRDPASYIPEILQAREHGQSDRHMNILQYISSSLRTSAIVEIEAITGPYWAIGPQNSLAGDWMVPLQLLGQNDVVPMLCLRPTGSMRAEPPRGLKRRGATVGERLQYIFSSGRTADLDCLHVAVKFIGPGRDYSQEREVQLGDESMQAAREILKRTAEAASRKGLPGPIVFDII